MTCSVTNDLTSWANSTINGSCGYGGDAPFRQLLKLFHSFFLLLLLLVDWLDSIISLVTGMSERVSMSNEECAWGLMVLNEFYFHKQINRLAAQVLVWRSESYIMLLSYNRVTLPTIDKYISGKRFELSK